MIKKLRIKFIVILMSVITVMLAVILAVAINSAGRNMRMQSIDLMRSLSTGQRDMELPGSHDGEVRLPFFTVQISRRGEILAMSGGYFDLSDEEYVLEIICAALESEDESGELTQYGLRYLKNKTPVGYTISFTDIATERITLRNMLFSNLAIFFVAELIFLGISVLLSYWAIRPVERAWDQQRQFVADASHELKTPLSVIMANAELVQNAETTDEEKRNFSRNILTTTYQMRALVENMLEMARVDNGSVNMSFGPVDFSQLVADAVLSFQLLYEEKGMGLESSISGGIILNGSEQHLYQVMDVLLDNGLKYSTSGGTVWVSLSVSGRNCVLAVASPGEPISGEDLKNIFKRFYRADKARAMNGSYGLGLSIAESVVRSHKGKIRAESANGYNTFIVQLPVGHERKTAEI